MQKILTTLAVAAAITFVAGVAEAHPRQYVALGDVVSVCFTDGGALTDVPSVGGSCWNAGHVPAVLGKATVGISDTVQNPVGGFTCQDLNGDVLCGGAGELSVLFCGSTAITTAGGWNTAVGSLWVFVNGPVGGILDAAQGGQCNAPSTGTVGTIFHS
jgi:hypothetical protein